VPRGYQRIPVISEKKDQTFKNWLCESRFLGRALPGTPQATEDDPITGNLSLSSLLLIHSTLLEK
jgi:hypothetical protein